MVLELKDKLGAVEATGANAGVAEARPSWSVIEQDVLSALTNLGCSRPAAEEAVRKARDRGAPAEFEGFFRAALALVR